MVSRKKTDSARWLITGGCGFIGTSLISRLLKNMSHIDIRVLDNLSVGKEEDLGEVCPFMDADVDTLNMDGSHIGSETSSQVKLIIGDIREYKTCLACCEDIDVVVHLAANTGVGPSVENPRADMESNVIGTFNMLEASRVRKVDRFIFASSGAPIGEVEPPIHEELAPHPVSPYGAGKLAGEGYCSSYYRTFGIKTVALRFGNVYGPRSGHKSSVVAKFIRRALCGQALEIHGDGNQTRDFIYIDDLVDAILLSANADVGGEVFQIATDRETSVNEIAMAIREMVQCIAGKPVEVVHEPPRLGDVTRNYSDISKARKKLGFVPKYNLEKGLSATLEYFLKGSSNTSLA